MGKRAITKGKKNGALGRQGDHNKVLSRRVMKERLGGR